MGSKANQSRRRTERRIRETPLTPEELERLSGSAYEGSPYHKRNPGDFGLTPPAAPRRDATLCDEAGIFHKATANDLFALALSRPLVSDTFEQGFPKHLWAVDAAGRVFEATYGGSRPGRYHGYPIRRDDPLHDKIRELWSRHESS